MNFFSRLLRFVLPIWLVVPMMALALVVGLGGGYVTALQLTTPCPLSRAECDGLSNFWRVWELARKEYVDPQAADPTTMTDAAIAGLVDSLGDTNHSRYLTPREARAERESLAAEFTGIGAYIDVRDGQPIIVQPMEGTPAERAGLKPNDAILAVNGEDVRGVTISELQTRVRGPAGTEVTLTIERAGEIPFDVTITRAAIQIPSVSWRMLPGNIAHIRLSQFTNRAGDEMKQALREAQSQGAQAIILDLRNNTGGLVTELLKIAGEFLPEGTTVLIEEDRKGNRIPRRTDEAGIAQTIPLVVLVNGNSASAGEILPGALKEAGRAPVIGQPTYGTATVLRLFTLENGAELRLGTTQWLTPGGEVVRGKGIEPTELVPMPADVAPLSPTQAAQLTREELLDNTDVQLARAYQVALGMAR
jgi:carboxyl-terminal processing protease